MGSFRFASVLFVFCTVFFSTTSDAFKPSVTIVTGGSSLDRSSSQRPISQRDHSLRYPRSRHRGSRLRASSPSGNKRTKGVAVEESSGVQAAAPIDRRRVWTAAAVRVAQVAVAGAGLVVLTRPAWAMKKSRSDGYAVQKTEAEWNAMLSPLQYEILRLGGTETPYSSILEGEERDGTYQCAGCGTPLFAASDKFHSGTGWPSFARALDGVEVEQVDPVTASLAGAELRCGTCGGHLGDVFRDGFLFVGTEAAKTGRRHCIDGAALVFIPTDGGDPVRGDASAKQKKQEQPDWLQPPTITPKD